MNKKALLFEAFLLGGPATGLMLLLLPFVVMVYVQVVVAVGSGQTILTRDSHPFAYAALAYPLGGFAIIRLWVLCLDTAHGRRSPTGWRLWLAAGSGVLAALTLGAAIGHGYAALAWAPLAALAVHMMQLQRRLVHDT